MKTTQCGGSALRKQAATLSFFENIRIFAPGIKVVDAKPIVDVCRTSILTVPEKTKSKTQMTVGEFADLVRARLPYDANGSRTCSLRHWRVSARPPPL